ncbi:hypothetical protein KY495_01365 [Massilia sp. PAMC28688]|uniref:hypothetical protein n=1 Tax=Massilia sp. PAMC28688 TaxID=2861283 RepID=UPI001C63749E|nr:hypothetical protein [Massilia sp. PAMC28688]QYF93920.1 hypothetical protein KY495_01365 [Massilia sp. PAMC28688]
MAARSSASERARASAWARLSAAHDAFDSASTRAMASWMARISDLARTCTSSAATGMEMVMSASSFGAGVASIAFSLSVGQSRPGRVAHGNYRTDSKTMAH